MKTVTKLPTFSPVEDSQAILDHMAQHHGWPRYSLGYWRLQVSTTLMQVFGQRHTPGEIHDWLHGKGWQLTHDHGRE
jgi:hypothetical protein